MNLDKFTSEGKFLMLALDHRGSIKKLMNPADPDSVADDDVIKLKSDIISSLASQLSGVLIDEVWGIEACKEVCQVKPFLLPLEKTGYIESDGEKITELEFSVEQLKEMGASGAKLLLYFNPDAESAEKQLATAKLVMEDCRNNDFPFFLEIVTYAFNPGLSTQFQTGIVGSNVILQSLQQFLENGIVPSVWKLEYPGSFEACQEITSLVGNTPWILLTGGKSFEEFKGELEKAVASGAKGFLAGRALWQEVCKLEGEEKKKFLETTLPERFKEISSITS